MRKAICYDQKSIMKTIIRQTALYGVAIFAIQAIFPGVSVTGGLATYVLAGFILALLFFAVKPILQVITLPLHIATLGLFTFVINAALLYLLTLFFTQIKMAGFVFMGAKISGFVIPKMMINTFFLFVLSGIVISVVVNGVKWVFEE